MLTAELRAEGPAQRRGGTIKISLALEEFMNRKDQKRLLGARIRVARMHWSVPARHMGVGALIRNARTEALRLCVLATPLRKDRLHREVDGAMRPAIAATCVSGRCLLVFGTVLY